MQNRATARRIDAGSWSRQACQPCTSRRSFLDRPFRETRIGRPVHIADVLPAVLRDLTSAKGANQ